MTKFEKKLEPFTRSVYRELAARRDMPSEHRGRTVDQLVIATALPRGLVKRALHDLQGMLRAECFSGAWHHRYPNR